MTVPAARVWMGVHLLSLPSTRAATRASLNGEVSGFGNSAAKGKTMTITLIADPRCDSWTEVYAAIARGELPGVPDAVDHDREYVHCTFNQPTTKE